MGCNFKAALMTNLSTISVTVQCFLPSKPLPALPEEQPVPSLSLPPSLIFNKERGQVKHVMFRGVKQLWIMTQELTDPADSFFFSPTPSTLAEDCICSKNLSCDLNRQPAGSKPAYLFFRLQPFRLHGYHNCSCSEDMLLPSGPRPPALELRSLSQAEPGCAGRYFFSFFSEHLRNSVEYTSCSPQT